MNKSAILHIPLSQYAAAGREKLMTIRLRAAKGDLSACTLYYGDRACPRTPVSFSPLSMRAEYEDEFFAYYEVTFKSPFERVCYYFKLEKEDEWYFYYADQFTKELADIEMNGSLIEGRSEYYQYPFILRNEIMEIPEWFQNAVVYNIFPDSFADGKRKITKTAKEKIVEDGNTSHARLGGTISGILENLDYIQDLGFDCIYLNPIFTAGEYHKYDLLDYYHIDPCFGTNEDFKNLVDEVHRRGMHIIIDGVFNHTSWYFFAFSDVVENGEASVYKDWYYDLSFPVIRPASYEEEPAYQCFAYERKMPKLNTSNKKVQEYFAKVGQYWVHEFKVDGWRLDVANEIDRNFWRTFREAVKSVNKEAVLIGEVWENAETWLRGDAFDSTMNYDFRKHCRDFFAMDRITAETFAQRLTTMRLRYCDTVSNGQLNLLDSHDVPRFLSLCKGDLQKWKQAFLVLMLFPGVPSLFYGDECEIMGIEENEYRSPMKWGYEQGTLTEYVKKVISIRKEYLNSKSTYKVWKGHEDKNVFAFIREGEHGIILVIINREDRNISLNLPPMRESLITESVTERDICPGGFAVFLL